MDRHPAGMVVRIDWSMVWLGPGWFVDPDLRMVQTDHGFR
jgi:hypothetical protein